jgi:hypothetical protein
LIALSKDRHWLSSLSKLEAHVACYGHPEVARYTCWEFRHVAANMQWLIVSALLTPRTLARACTTYQMGQSVSNSRQGSESYEPNIMCDGVGSVGLLAPGVLGSTYCRPSPGGCSYRYKEKSSRPIMSVQLVRKLVLDHSLFLHLFRSLSSESSLRIPAFA